MKLQPRHGYLAAGLITGLTLGVGGTLALSAHAAPGSESYGKLNVFSSAYAMILSRYVHEIPAEKLISAAVRGMVKELAPNLFEGSGPGCLYGTCPEGKMTCGKPYKPEDVDGPAAARA